tara:strand:- start:3260 stop:3724 length:465 start_codon:yes stop_codon:yes gene_type:complete
MLAVIAVIGILAGLVFRLAFFAEDEEAIKKAAAELTTIDAALHQYKTSNQSKQFPETGDLTDEKAMNALLYAALSGTSDPNNPGLNRLSLPSLVLQTEGGMTYIEDPWGNPYFYQSKPPANRFTLFSKGPDGRASTDDDGTPEDDNDNVYPSGN